MGVSQTTSAPAVDTGGAQSPSGTTPISRVARRRRARRMVFAVLLVVIGVATWRMAGPSTQNSLIPQTAPAAAGEARTPQEALAQLRSPEASAPVSSRLKAGAIAAQNYFTAMGTYDGFVFPGATVVSGSKGTVVIVQDAGTCYTRTLTDGAAGEVVNDPAACTAAGQLALRQALA